MEDPETTSARFHSVGGSRLSKFCPLHHRKWTGGVAQVIPGAELRTVVVAGLLFRLSLLAFATVKYGAQGAWDSGLEAVGIAHSLATGQGFSSPFGIQSGPTMWMPPLYPALIALVFKIFGALSSRAALALGIINTAVATLTLAAVYCLGKRTFGARAALWAAWIWAVCPYLVSLSLKMWETSFSALFTTLGFLFYFRLQQSARRRDWAAFGVFWGVAALTNTVLVTFLLFSWAALAWQLIRRHQRWLWQLSLSVVIVIMIVSPWVARNYVVFGKLVPIRGNLGIELWLPNHEGSSGPNDRRAHLLYNQTERARYASLGEARYAEEKQHAAIMFIRMHPGTYLNFCARRIFHFWMDAEALPLWGPVSFVLTLVGLIMGLRRSGRVAAPFLFMLAAYPLVYYAVHTLSWYRHALEPLMCILMGNAVANSKVLSQDGEA